MSDYDEPNRNITRWWDKFNFGEDWNSMPVGMRKDMVRRLHLTLIDLYKFNIKEKEILALIKLTDPPTVWHALLQLHKLPPSKSNWEVLRYLRTVVINTWEEQHPIKPNIEWQKAPVDEGKKRVPASLEMVDKWSSLNFGSRNCSFCGKTLRKNNMSGYCRDCQRQRNGKDIEH